MLNRAFKLSSNWQFFRRECESHKIAFARLHYPETLVENTIRHFIEMKVTENVRSNYPMNEMLPSELSYRSKTRNRQMR